MKSTILPAGILLLTLVLGACGQSGPLYVPGDPSTIHPPPEQAKQIEQQQSDQDKDKKQDDNSDQQ